MAGSVTHRHSLLMEPGLPSLSLVGVALGVVTATVEVATCICIISASNDGRG